LNATGESSQKELSVTIPSEMAGRRLDQVLSELLPEYSRSRLKQWIDGGQVQVDGRVLRPKDKVAGGEAVTVQAVVEADGRYAAEAIPLNIVYEDDTIIVLDKPADFVVHPAAGNWEGTLLNALLHHAPELASVPRAGIVHRIDKDTTGLLVVARTLEAQTSLVEQLQERSVGREYEAVVHGVMTAGGSVDAPIDRHPVDRKRMAVVQGGKPAVTHYRLVERFRTHTHIRVKLETGRTHQIRVHFAALRHPCVGDLTYGADPTLAARLGLDRQWLHARRLGFTHPGTGRYVEFESPYPADLARALDTLRA
jgi:23S rRNA pseudouridine1911/1915/1917 synthase